MEKHQLYRAKQRYKKCRNEHLASIRSAMMDSWKEFSQSSNKNAWGRAYKWASKGSRQNIPPSILKNQSNEYARSVEETAKILLDTFVPKVAEALNWIQDESTNEAFRNQVTEEENMKAIWRIGSNKAPGHDGLTAGLIKKAWPYLKENTTLLMGKVVEESTCPDCWKSAELILLSKGNDIPKTDPKSYRLVSLLPVLSPRIR